MTVSLGAINSYSTFSPTSHNWAEAMNHNLIKAAHSLHPSVKARVSSYPGSPSAGDCYLNTTNNVIGVYTAKHKANGSDPDVYDWHEIGVAIGTLLYVENERKFIVYTNFSTWETAWDLDDTHPSMERSLTAFVPGFVAPGGRVINYVPSIEFAIPAGAPGSKAHLEEPPVGGNLVLSMTGGSITFANGSTTGVFNVPSETVIRPSEFESMYSQPGTFQVTVAGGNTYDAKGLSVSIKGYLRSIHVG